MLVFELDFRDCVTFATMALAGAGFVVTPAAGIARLSGRFNRVKLDLALGRGFDRMPAAASVQAESSAGNPNDAV